MSHPPSPFDDPVPRGLNVVLATLRIVVALQCWGLAANWLHAGDDSGFIEFLTRHDRFTQPMVEQALTRTSWGIAACGALTLVRPCWPVLLPVVGWFGFAAFVAAVTRHPLEPAEQAARIMTPLTLLLLDFWPPRPKFSIGLAAVAIFLLRLGAAAAFIGHGLAALQQARDGGNFVELITGSLENVLHRTVTTAQAQQALGVIGGLDIGLGVGLLLTRSRTIALSMAFCGTLAAASWVLAYGPDAWRLVLLRAADGGAPFALFLYWFLALKELPPITLPAGK
jgi:hypothetical protein